MTETTADATPKQAALVQPEQIRNWIGVVSRDDVRQGVSGGFVMMEQGKLGPLLRFNPGDWLIFYSPRATLSDRKPLKKFTAIGRVTDAEPYQVPMETGKTVFRRDIDWMKAKEVQISDLSEKLDFMRGNWGMLTRRGLFEITDADRHVIRVAMTGE
ncbi:EVE domain-containing protein [Paracoccus onubensis]|uniref:EVE domain-containing protein n=1 Tax=Paracoccus onubensis TaxID=1675788 RepID=UPI00272EEEB1|nr:EVE domain-containing protein [Paracoccus onubensis]MDP0928880.1 EVE domain-containing protein [Paracoccus onubensis]